MYDEEAVYLSKEEREAMKILMSSLLLATLMVHASNAQQRAEPPTESITTAATHTPEQQELINLSSTKWDWMADKKVDCVDRTL